MIQGRTLRYALFFALAGRSLLFFWMFSLIFYFAVFDEFEQTDIDFTSSDAVAIVFTGQFERLDSALELLAAGTVGKVFISGVNAGAGLDIRTLHAFLKKRNTEITDLERLLECCVMFGSAAENTNQNAAEAKCWVERIRPKGRVILVTSRLHMARALFALRVALPQYDITPYPVQTSGGELSGARQREFSKLLVTVIADTFARLRRKSEAFPPICKM